MHMADALLSPAVGGTMLAVSAGVLACSLRDLRKNFQESRIPLMGVAGAFVFAAQMVNFAIPGTGSSGHIGGAVLLAALLGPSPAFLVMAGVLLIQALFFADGGVLAWGCNLFNLGFFGSDKLADRFAKFGYNYNIIRYEGCGHEIAGLMNDTCAYQFAFLETNVMGGKRYIVDMTVEDPSIERSGTVSRKELFGGE